MQSVFDAKLARLLLEFGVFILYTYIIHTHTSAEPSDFDTKHALLLLVCVYLFVYFGSVFGFHLPTTISTSAISISLGGQSIVIQLSCAP